MKSKTFVSLRMVPVEDNYVDLDVVSTITGEVIICIRVTVDTLQTMLNNIKNGFDKTESLELGAFVGK